MEKEIYYLFLSLVIMTSAAVAQAQKKPFVIQNLLPCTVGIEKSNGQRFNLNQNQSSPALAAQDFPVHAFSGCGGAFLTPPSSSYWSQGCYKVQVNQQNQIHLVPAVPCPKAGPA